MRLWPMLLGPAIAGLLCAFNQWMMWRAIKARGHFVVTIPTGESEWHGPGECTCDEPAKQRRRGGA